MAGFGGPRSARGQFRLMPSGGGQIRGRQCLPLFFAALFMAVWGCSTSSGLDPNATDEIVVAIEAAPTNLDPRLGTDAYSERLGQLLFSKLVRVGPNMEVVPDLAVSWDIPSPTVYRFHLKPGVRFHDGTPVTAKDVIYTFEWIKKPGNASAHRAAYDVIEKMVAEDDLTVRFELSAPHAPFLVNMVRGIVPAHLGDDPEYKQHPIGSGPYKLTQYKPGESLHLTAFDDYVDGRPPTDRLTFRIIPEDTVRLLALKRGDVHMVINALPPDSLDLIAREPHLKVARGPGNNYSYLGFNMQDPLLKIPRVRRAIAHAIDKDTIIDAIYRNQARPATGLLTPEHWAYEADVNIPKYDPEAAKKLLDEAGFPVPKAGEPRFRLIFKTSQNELTRRIGEVIQQQLKEVGIAMAVRSYEWGTFYGDIKAGNFQLYTLAWVGIAEPDIYYSVFHTDSAPPGGANRGRYSNPQVDKLVQAARITPDRAERARLYSQVQQILARELPYVSLWHPEVVVVYDKRLTGFELTPQGAYDSLARTRLVNTP